MRGGFGGSWAGYTGETGTREVFGVGEWRGAVCGYPILDWMGCEHLGGWVSDGYFDYDDWGILSLNIS